jgi:hypothetical protein
MSGVASPTPVILTNPKARELIKRRERYCEDNRACWHQSGP